MRKLGKVAGYRQDTVEAYAARCTGYCVCRCVCGSLELKAGEYSDPSSRVAYLEGTIPSVK